MPLDLQRKRGDLRGRSVEFKALPAEFKADRGKRRIEGWYASYGNVDQGGDLIEPFAGQDFIQKDWENHLIKTYWNHWFPIGPRPELIQEEKGGLFAVSSVTEVPEYDLYLAQIEDHTAAHGSIGWINKASVRDTLNGLSIRRIKSYRLIEVSPVYYPMNEATSVTMAKALGTLGEAAESKSLYGLAEAIYALASARSAFDYVERLLTPRAELTPEEQDIVERLYGDITAMSKVATELVAKSLSAPSVAQKSEGSHISQELLAQAAKSLTDHIHYLMRTE